MDKIQDNSTNGIKQTKSSEKIIRKLEENDLQNVSNQKNIKDDTKENKKDQTKNSKQQNKIKSGNYGHDIRRLNEKISDKKRALNIVRKLEKNDNKKEKNIVYDKLKKMVKQKGRCTKFPVSKDDCYRDDKNNCLACRPGYVPENFKCKKCAPKCIQCDRENKCTKCGEGNILSKLGPRDIVCVGCDPLKHIFDSHNSRCIPFKDMNYKEKLKPFQDTQFMKFNIPEIKIPNAKNLFVYFQFWFRWGITPYKLMINIKSMDDQGQEIPVKKYIGIHEWNPKKTGQKKYKTVIRFRIPVRPNKKIKLSIKPSIDSKEDFSTLLIEDLRFSFQHYSEDPFLITGIESKLNLKDLPPPKPTKLKKGDKNKKGDKKDDKSSRRIEGDQKIENNDKNLYKKIAEEDVLSERITKISSLSQEDLRDVITKQTMIKALPNESQVALRTLKLNLEPSLK